jgi:hypothetical protein
VSPLKTKSPVFTTGGSTALFLKKSLLNSSFCAAAANAPMTG